MHVSKNQFEFVWKFQKVANSGPRPRHVLVRWKVVKLSKTVHHKQQEIGALKFESVSLVEMEILKMRDFLKPLPRPTIKKKHKI